MRSISHHPNRRPFIAAAVAALAGLLLVTSADTPARAANSKQVNDSIKKSVKFLYDTQKDGNWELVGKRDEAESGHSVSGGNWGGMTAMATYGLLAAGENPQDPRLTKAIDWLFEKEIVGTYSIALRAQVWLLLSEKNLPKSHPWKKKLPAALKRDRDLLYKLMHTGGVKLDGGSDRPNRQESDRKRENPQNEEEKRKAEEAEKAMIAAGERFGFYTYYWDPYKGSIHPPDHYDRSNSQYGVLGMWALEQAGAEIHQKYWEICDRVWKKVQNDDGGWEYAGDGPSTATMSTAGLATLFITQDYLMNNRGECKGNVTNPNIEKGLAWMDKNAGGAVTAGSLYLMYGVERVGLASGRKYFGGTDWYAQGASWLVSNQGGDGAWGGEDPIHSPKKVPNTVFGLLFLVRGRAPVVMNKLEYASVAKEGDATGWNQRPRDVASFTRWMSRQSEGGYNWQIVNLKVSPDDLHDAPLLYIGGSDELAFTPEEEAKIREYVEAGGIIIGNADCQRKRFTDTFKRLGKKLFPKYEFRDLPSNHPIYTSQQFHASKWKAKPKVMGMSNGVRELMLLVPQADVSRFWQGRGDKQNEALFQLGANIYYYSVDRETGRYKGDTYIVKDPGSQPARTVKLARLQVGDNPDPEPGAWKRLNAILKTHHNTGLDVQHVKLGEGKLAGVAIAHLTGTTKFTLAAPQRDELKKWIEGGGTLIVDAAGGATDFANAAEAEIAAMFGNAAAAELNKSLTVEHPVFNQGDAAKIERIAYRDYARRVLADVNGRAPRLKAITVNGRPGVFYSREDLTAGMVGQQVDGVVGYTPAVSTAIMRNLVLFSLSNGKGPVAAGG